MDWRGIAAAVLAFGVAAVLLAATIFAGLNPARIVAPDEIATASTVLGAAVGAIAVYLGGGKGNGKPPGL